ncbi:MAG TPA: DUF4129 domain-containing protein [Candidatus Cybelea sp.]
MIGREALVRRWLSANHTHSIAKLNSAPAAKNAVAPNLYDLAQRELNTPGRYQLAKPALPPAGEPWWLRVWDWLADRWQQFWSALFGHVHVGSAQAASIGDVLLVAVGMLLVYVLIRLLRDLQFARQSATAHVETLAEAPSPRVLYNDAVDAASRGDYGTAALLLFTAMVLLLDRRHAIALTKSATVGDLRRALRAGSGALVAPFDAVAGPFVQRAYAERPISETQWKSAQQAFVTLSLSKGDKSGP